jgi:GNAT superfamily N-acetyltransferase
MDQSYTIIPITEAHLQPAVELFLESYRQERAANPLLPTGILDDPGRIYSTLQACLGSPGVVVFQENRLLAYMLTGARFTWKGQQAALVPEYAHSAQQQGKQELYQLMYQQLAQEWLVEGIHLHLVGHLAHDPALLETLYMLGFGAIVCEQLRDLSTNVEHQAIPIREEVDPQQLIDLELEHRRYYQRSPIFLSRPTGRDEALADITAQIKGGDHFYVAYEEVEPCAYMILGEAGVGDEGFLLQKTNSAQIKSAYARPNARGKGIGRALLQYAIEWSSQGGFERLFVEHETANVSGGNFWRKHFVPFVYFSMRYIDSTI